MAILTEDKLKHIRDLKYQTAKIVRFMDKEAHEELSGRKRTAAYIHNDLMKDCMTHWVFDMYKESKVAHVKKIWRCKDKFCYNCRVVDVAKRIEDFLPRHEEMIKRGYVPLMLTVTVKNVPDLELATTIEKLFYNYSKLIENFKRKRFVNQPFDIKGALAILEINKNHETEEWHPHIHSLIYIDKAEYSKLDYEKHIKGEFRKKTQTYQYYSDMDMYFKAVWTSLYRKNVKLDFLYDRYTFENDKGEREYKNTSGLMQAQIEEVKDGYILEVIKYTYKIHDIVTYNDYKFLKAALTKFKKTRMYGELAKIKSIDIDKEKEDISQYLQENEISISESHELDYLFTMIRKDKYKIVCTSSLTNIIDKYKLFDYQ